MSIDAKTVAKDVEAELRLALPHCEITVKNAPTGSVYIEVKCMPKSLLKVIRISEHIGNNHKANYAIGATCKGAIWYPIHTWQECVDRVIGLFS